MDKIKNILTRGDKNESSTTNPTSAEGNTGGLTGEGTHFGKATQGNFREDKLNTRHSSTAIADPPDSAVQMSSTSASGTGSGTGRGTLDSQLRPTMSDRTISAASVKSGVVGLSPATTTADNQPLPGPSPTAYRTVEGTPQHGNFDFESDRQAAQHSDLGTGAGDLGVGTGASTIAAEKAFRDYQAQESAGAARSDVPSSNVASSNLTTSATGEREFPLSGGTTTGAPATDRTEPGVPSTLGGGPPRSEQTIGDGRAGLASAAGGVLEHEHGGHGHAFEGDPCPPGENPAEGTPHFSSGPHTTDTANRLDPNLQPSGTSQSGLDSQSRSAQPTTLASQPEHAQQSERTTDPTPETQGTSGQHHYGRDAALAGAGVTAAGAGAEALGSGDRQDTGPASNTIGPHKSDAANVVDPRVQPEPEKMKNVGTRDTDTGPASATVGPHESNAANVVDPKVQPDPEKMKDRETTGPHRSDLLNRLDPRVDSSRKNADSGDAGTRTGGATGADVGGDPNISSPYNVKPVDPRVDAQSGSQTQDKEHHYGRDAAVAGGTAAAGVAGYGAYEASKDRDQPISSSEPSSTGYGSQPSTAAEPITTSQSSTTAPHSQPSATTQQAGMSQPTGVAGYTNEPRTTARETSPDMPGAFPEPAEQEKPHSGRDAALAGGAAATGGGAYEATRPKTSEPISSSQPSDTGYGSQPGPAAQPPSDEKDKHHYGRDAAVAGGAGAIGAGAYEASRSKAAEPASTAQTADMGHSSQPTSATQQPTQASSTPPSNTGLGTQTSSVAPQSGAVTSGPARVTEHDTPANYGTQTTPHDGQQEARHHYGRDAAVAGGVGAAGAGAYEASKHTDGSSRDPQTTGIGHDIQQPSQASNTVSPQQPQHHYGRDAALAGGVGAVGAGAYEADKHIDDSNRASGLRSGYDSQRAEAPTQHPAHPAAVDTTGTPSTTGTATHAPTQAREEPPQQHHYGRDAAVAGGAGAVGAGAAYEYQQHEAEKQAKEAQAEAEKGAKQQQKELEKRQAQADKDLKAQQKENEKEAKKEQKEHDKTVAAAEKQHEKDLKKQEKEHDKAVAAEEKDHKKQEEKKLAAGTGGAVAAGGATYEVEEHKDHKDKDQDEEKHKKPGLLEKILHPRRSKEQSAEEAEAAENERTIRGKAQEHEDQPHGVAADENGRHRLHKDPPASHPAAQGDQGIVTEPHTGLPMNVGKYGSGEGGTDGAAQIRNPAEEGFEPTKTDWEQIKKANTPY